MKNKNFPTTYTTLSVSLDSRYGLITTHKNTDVKMIKILFVFLFSVVEIRDTRLLVINRFCPFCVFYKIPIYS